MIGINWLTGKQGNRVTSIRNTVLLPALRYTLHAVRYPQYQILKNQKVKKSNYQITSFNIELFNLLFFCLIYSTNSIIAKGAASPLRNPVFTIRV